MAQARTQRFSTADILTIAVVAAVGGVVSAFVVLPWAKFIEGVLGPFGAALNNPFFITWYLIAGLLLRRPGVTLATGILTGIVEVLAGSLDGSIVLVFVTMQAVGAELGMAAFGHRRSIGGALLGGGLAGIGCFVSLTFFFGFVVLPVWQLALLALAKFVGDAILGGGLAFVVVRAIERTGVMGQVEAV